jgi:hypothetical protein
VSFFATRYTENARFWQKNDEKRQGKIQIKKIKKFIENVEKKLDK